jgi:hypothetical protein
VLLTERALIKRQSALLAASSTNERLNAWAQELLERRAAVARWRGQRGCSIRDVMQTLAAMQG